MKKKITIRDLAKEAGVSVTTVSIIKVIDSVQQLKNEFWHYGISINTFLILMLVT